MNKFNDKLYMSICSERTLQSNSQGFFLTFADHVAENAGENWIKYVFGRLKTDKERIRLIYEYEPIKNAIIEIFTNVDEVYRKKSAEISQSKRLEAENILKSDNNATKALILFSQSVLRAPKTGENMKIDCGATLGLALWGRSNAFIALQNYSYALKDIQLSLKENLPNIYKAEAYWKMGICYKAIHEENKANVAFSLAEKLLVNKMKLEQLQKDKEKKVIDDHKEDEKDRRIEPIISGGKHKKFPYASIKITVKQTEDLGRYVVANEQIKTGETLVVEPPYAACLLPDMFGTHCHHCFNRLIAPMGCDDCSSVAFCSVECKKEATSTYHQFECKYLDLLIGSGMSILGHTALRMITQTSLDKILEIYKDRSKEKVYSLCTNSTNRPATDFLQRTLMAAFLLRCLQKSGYFIKNNSDVIIPTEQEYCVGELLLFHLQMLQFNAHEIYETRHSSEHRFRGSKAAYVGVAVYPTVALFNHDCYPAVTRYFVGKKIVIKAVRPLNSQDVIAENYGPIFTRKRLQERQRSLSSRYWFNCQCNACINNWPSIGLGLENVTERIRCNTKKCNNLFTLPMNKEETTCPKCKKIVNLTDRIKQLQWCNQQYELGFAAMDNESPELGIKLLCAAIDLFHNISNPPHKATHLAQETLRACCADTGNLYKILQIN